MGNLSKFAMMEKIIVKYLFEGKSQKEIAVLLKEQGIEPNSLSSIEKTLKNLKAQHDAKTMFHLGAILTIKKYIRGDRDYNLT